MGIQINGNTNNINAGIGSLSIEDINELDIVGEIIEEVKSRGISLNPRYRKTPIF